MFESWMIQIVEKHVDYLVMCVINDVFDKLHFEKTVKISNKLKQIRFKRNPKHSLMYYTKINGGSAS